MRWFLRILLLIAIAVPAAWMAGEALLARKVRQLIFDNPAVEAQSVGAMLEWWRFGLDLTGVRVDTPDGPAAFPRLQVWAAANRLNEVHMTLPPRMTLPIAGRARGVTTDGTDLSLRISPVAGMELTRADAISGPVSIDGERVLGTLSAQLQMVALGPDAPRNARLAYDVTLHATGMNPAPLNPQMAALPAPIDIDGRARLWMTGPINGRPAPDSTGPQLDGASSDGITLTLGDLSARLAGRVEADAQGFASGTLNVYTADARGFLDIAAQAGLIPTGSVMLADALVTGLGTEPARDVTPQDNGIPADDTATAPLPPNGELRLPIIMQDGRATLRGIPFGPAPRLR